MKKLFKILLIALAAILGFFLIAGLFIDKNYKFTTSIDIQAPINTVWEHVNSFKAMDSWNPWKDYDPNMKSSISGTDGTVGAIYTWNGNDSVGTGSQEILSLDPPRRINTALQFGNMKKVDVAIILEPSASQTKATWTLESVMPYPMNTMKLFINLDAQLDKDFGRGLQKLKKVCESAQQVKDKSMDVSQDSLNTTH